MKMDSILAIGDEERRTFYQSLRRKKAEEKQDFHIDVARRRTFSWKKQPEETRNCFQQIKYILTFWF